MVIYRPGLFPQVLYSGQVVSLQGSAQKSRAHGCGGDGVILDKCARGAEKDNSTIRMALYYIVTDDGVAAANADTISPLKSSTMPARTNVIVLNDDVIAVKTALCNVEAGPTPRIKRMHVFDQLIRICAAHLDICSAPSYSG